jgi:hypothetical protein
MKLFYKNIEVDLYETITDLINENISVKIPYYLNIILPENSKRIETLTVPINTKHIYIEGSNNNIICFEVDKLGYFKHTYFKIS